MTIDEEHELRAIFRYLLDRGAIIEVEYRKAVTKIK